MQLFRQRPSTPKSICTQTYSKQRGFTVNRCYVAHTCALCAYQILCGIDIKVGPRLCAEPAWKRFYAISILCRFFSRDSTRHKIGSTTVYVLCSRLVKKTYYITISRRLYIPLLVSLAHGACYLLAATTAVRLSRSVRATCGYDTISCSPQWGLKTSLMRSCKTRSTLDRSIPRSLQRWVSTKSSISQLTL